MINPYHYPVIDARLEPARNQDLYERMMSTDASSRTSIDAPLTRLSEPVMDRVLAILSLSYDRSQLRSWTDVLAIQASNAKQPASPQEAEWEEDPPPTELSLILTIAAAQSRNRGDWHALQLIVQALSEDQRQDLSSVFSYLYGITLDNLFLPPKGLWACPRSEIDLPEMRNILGRDFAHLGDGKWKRVDLCVQNFKVFLIEGQVEYDEEDGSSRYAKRGYQVGCAATPEGAIDVASQILPRLYATYRKVSDGFHTIDGPDKIALRIQDCRGEVLLAADLSEQPAPGLQGGVPDTYRVGYDATWQQPVPLDQVESTIQKIQKLESDASEESRWDNFSSAQNLRKEAAALKAKLPSKNYDLYALQLTLRQTLARLGDHKQASRLLSSDLGL